MSDSPRDRLEPLQETLGYRFSQIDLLARALRHGSSAAAQDRGSYQRLEFLGDAVLDHVIAEVLFERFPKADEGLLTRMRSHLVQSSSLASRAAWLGLDGWVQLGPSEQMGRGRERSGLLEDLFEAVIGAIERDGGWEAARDFVVRQFQEEINRLDERSLMLGDPKTTLIQAAQKRGLPLPLFEDSAIGGDPHKPLWASFLRWDGEIVARGEGRNKRDAEQQAARRALLRLGLIPEK